jgi:hypothetical protein
MVWNPNGRTPSFRHLTLDSAKTEASRLARTNPLEQFCVLECVGAVMQKPPPTFWFDAVDRPPDAPVEQEPEGESPI